jgi:Flp pilus assembly pilin Flp
VGSERGAATVEHAGLSLLIALLAIAGIAALAARPSDAGRDLGFTLGRKLRCAAVGPGPCWRDPLTEAYGRPLAGAVRALAPAPVAVSGLLPVDFRYCRSASCAAPGSRPGLTASNRRVTAFAAVDDRRGSTGEVTITYWHYRPTLGWERVEVTITAADVDRLAPTELLDTAVPALVPLETIAGRNHYDFPPGEEPPWRWQVESVYP